LVKNAKQIQSGLQLTLLGIYACIEKGHIVGEIDSIFSFEEVLFIIEVSKQKDHKNKTISNFEKWSADENIQLILNQFSSSPKLAIQIYVNVNDKISDSNQLERLTRHGSKNFIINSHDLAYFTNQYEKIGSWANNDLLNWLDVEGKPTSTKVHAIQYYIHGLPVFCFVERVDNLLKSCYVSRRRNNDNGYQRTLKTSRIT
jgi:hypothetical protein